MEQPVEALALVMASPRVTVVRTACMSPIVVSYPLLK